MAVLTGIREPLNNPLMDNELQVGLLGFAIPDGNRFSIPFPIKVVKNIHTIKPVIYIKPLILECIIEYNKKYDTIIYGVIKYIK